MVAIDTMAIKNAEEEQPRLLIIVHKNTILIGLLSVVATNHTSDEASPSQRFPGQFDGNLAVGGKWNNG